MTEVDVRLREWEVARPDREDRYGLRGVWLEHDKDRTLAAQLTRAGMLEVTELKDGLSVRALAHVGRVQLGRVVVTVEPKVAPDDLLDLLRYAYGLRNLRLLDAAEFATTGRLLQDLVVAQLLAEVRELLRRGMSREYTSRTELLSSPRGRVDMGALVRRAPLVEPAITCRHHPRSGDHLLNRVVLAGLRLAEQVASDSGLRFAVARTKEGLANDIASVRLDVTSLRRAWDHVDRMTAHYGAALKLTEILYACSSVTHDGATTTRLPGFLFDMNRFFQALVGRLLVDHLPELEVRGEQGLSGMMRYLPHQNPRGRKAPTPRPDFALVQRGGQTVALLDAKYRDLWERELPREMLYQLAMYAVSTVGSTAAIIFPTSTAGASEAVVEIKDPGSAAVLGFVALRPLALPTLVGLMRDSQRNDMLALVRGLAFGATAAETARQ